MKKLARYAVSLLLAASMLWPGAAYAAKGGSGYEGGISSGEAPGKTTYDYQEVCFVSGEPVVFKGTVMIKKTIKQDTVSATYTYNLKNIDKAATMTRVFIFDTKSTKKDNGQVVEETSISGRPSEIIKIGNVTYSLKSIDLTRSILVDGKPAISYYAGNMWSRKVFQVGTVTASNTVTVSTTGDICGYDQYWGHAEVIDLKYFIESEQKKGQTVDKWGGEADVAISSTVTKELKYVDNEPEHISFDGGYIESQNNSSILEYKSRLPEFDKSGISTDNMLETSDSLQLESLPVFKRLPVLDLSSIRGYWYEEDIKALYSLEILKGDTKTFNPQQYITRAEFTDAMDKAAPEVPKDPALTKTSIYSPGTSTKSSKQTIISPFQDVPADHTYFSSIDDAFKRGLVSGKEESLFRPDDCLTLAEAVTVFVRAMGLENLAPNPAPVTGFKDNDTIPEFARRSVYVAEKIGLINGDESGNLKPEEYLTNARAAVLINRFIDYMRTGIRADYREGIINYQ